MLFFVVARPLQAVVAMFGYMTDLSTVEIDESKTATVEVDGTARGLMCTSPTTHCESEPVWLQTACRLSLYAIRREHLGVGR